MKFDLLTNGTDSLRQSFQTLEKIEDLAIGIEHNIKDAVMYLNHANEILFKLILKKHDEYLIFGDISLYMKAKEIMIQQNMANVFEARRNLRTVNFHEAIKRLEFLCDIELSNRFKGSLRYLNNCRNKLMHFEFELNENEVWILVEKLKICHNLSIEFFKQHLEDMHELYETSRFEQTVDDYMDEMAELQAEMHYEDARIEAMEAAYEAMAQDIPGFE